MTKILVFYATPNRERVTPIVDALRAQQLQIWWAQEITHGQWGRAVEAAVQGASAAISIWSREALRPDCMVLREATYAAQNRVPLFHVRIDKVSLPVEFTGEVVVDLHAWNGNVAYPAFTDLIRGLRAVASHATKPPHPRPLNLPIGQLSVQIPSFVRSVSSFETILSPRHLLLALASHPCNEPILVSGYDLHPSRSPSDLERSEMLDRISTLTHRGAAIFLDSGNYEAYRNKDRPDSHIVKRADGYWIAEKLYESCRKVPFDIAFQFDDADPPIQAACAADKIIQQFKADSRVISARPVIPVVHTPKRSDGQYDHSALHEIIRIVAETLDTDIIAIPERELGNGLFQRARTVKCIRDVLDSTGRYRGLHLLGTGNPITLAILALAGADLFDGLEWCRTAVDKDTACLYHAQHGDLFVQDTAQFSEFPSVRDFMTDPNQNYYLRLLVHNLDFMYNWIEELRFNIRNRTMGNMLKMYLGGRSFNKLRQGVPDLF